ncbi:MAG TPA: CdaR family protein [Candidatus Binataceae bacterium]|nr:CdaR family protein [Candidatus Binataceae bacterium]
MSEQATKEVPLPPVQPRAMTMSLRQRMAAAWVRHNIGTRILSLLLAIGLWVFVNAGQRGSLQSFNVPISYRNIPPHFVITNPHPESVKIEVSGPRTLLSIIDANRLTVKLDLTGVGVGQASFKIDPDAFSLPRLTTLTSITPSQIILELDKVVSREVPTHLALMGKVAQGYRIVSLEMNPHTVTVRGPSKDLAHIDEVESEPIQLSGLTGNIERMVPLAEPSATVRIDPSEVGAKLVIGPIEEDRVVRAVPITVHNSAYPATVHPSLMSLTVHGPELVLDQLDRTKLVSIDASGFAPGNYEIPLEVTLPEGVKLVDQSVTKVRLRLAREKRAAKG